MVAVAAVFCTYFLFTPIYSLLLAHTWPLFFSVDSEPPRYFVDPALPAGDVVVGWQNSPIFIADTFYASKPAKNYLPDWLPDFNLVRQSWPVHLLPESSQQVWRPANGAYKQLIYRTSKQVFIDMAAMQDSREAAVELAEVIAGFRQLPVDLFGGLFIQTAAAPNPVPARKANSQFVIGQSNPMTRQFIDEVWALDNQQYAVTHVLAIALAALLTLLPWLTRRWFHYTALYFAGFILLNGLLYIALLLQFQWLYPFAMPLVSLLLAALWFARLFKFDKSYELLAGKYQLTTTLWVNRLLDDNQPEAAHRFLLENKLTRKPFAALWLLVARGFERNRHYDKAMLCLEEALALEPANEEAKSKLKSLRTVTEGTKTQVLAQGMLELPVEQLGSLTLGRYLLTRELGRGAMGVVYEAQDPKIHRHVALKVVHLKNLGIEEVDQVKQRFFREAQAAGKLAHPNIVTVYDVGEEHDVAYIAMDLLKGEVLEDLLRQRPIEINKMVRWIAQAAQAIAYAHENDVIHRDVKPANMIVEIRTGQVKLTDFGVARIAGVQHTQTGIVVGSPSYMSPEQMHGETLTGATDIFSLGVTLYQCITGELPFQGDTLPALAYAITQTKQESPRNVNPDVPVSLVRIINKAMQKDPADRYESARDFANSLTKWLTDRNE